MGREGNGMQEQTTGGGELGSPAARMVAFVHGAPALPTELNDVPLIGSLIVAPFKISVMR